MLRYGKHPCPTRRPFPTTIWSRTEYERAVEAGVFGPGARLELIEGAILAAGPQGSQHFTGIELVVDALLRTFGVGHPVRVQGPLAAGEDPEPEPDVAVVAGDARDFRDGHPTTALLVIEVSDDSLRHDRTVKQRLYARCGIPPLTIPFDSHALAARERCTWGRPRGSAGDPA